MVRTNTQTQTPGEAALAKVLVNWMANMGLEAHLQEVSPGRYNAIGILKGTGGGRSLMFNGHMDTNPATEGWTVDPWGGVTDEESIYGLGVSNMKAGCAAYLMAVERLMQSGVRLRGDAILTFVIGELQGGVGTLHAIEQGLRADYFVNCEPTDLAALTLHAGSLKFQIELTGSTRHLSKREEAVDAIAAACSMVPAINAMVFQGAESELHESVNRAHIGSVRGGLGREILDVRPPQVADVVRLLGAARYSPSQDPETVLSDIRAVAANATKAFPGLDVEVRGAATFGDFPPFEVESTSPVVRAVNRAFAAIRNVEQPTGAIAPYCFYGTDAAHLLHKAGMQGVVCGPGGKYNTMPDERVEIADYLDAITLYHNVMIELCEVDTGHSPA